MISIAFFMLINPCGSSLFHYSSILSLAPGSLCSFQNKSLKNHGRGLKQRKDKSMLVTQCLYHSTPWAHSLSWVRSLETLIHWLAAQRSVRWTGSQKIQPPPAPTTRALASVSIRCTNYSPIYLRSRHLWSFNSIQEWKSYAHQSKNHRDGTGERKGFGSEWFLCLEKERMWDEEALGWEPMLTVTDRPSGSVREGAICPSKGLIHKQPAIVPAFSPPNLPISTRIQIKLCRLLKHTDPCVVIRVDLPHRLSRC